MSDRPEQPNAARARLARTAKTLSGGLVPALILMTDDERLADPEAAVEALPAGSMVVIRAKTPHRLNVLAISLRTIARRRGLFLLVAGDPKLARRIGADGVHLPEARIGEAAAIRARSDLIITASTHSLRAALKAGAVDALILSAVFPTRSHPGKAALGPLRTAFMARLLPLASYGLGGIDAGNARRLAGVCGIAAIGALAAPKTLAARKKG